MFEKYEGFIPVEGGKIFYVFYGERRTKKPPLILVHGGPGFSHDTLEVLAPISKNRPIILYDQLGCGRSDRPNDKKLWNLNRYRTELNSIISYFRLNHYHILGHSFGGSIVLEYGLTHPSGLLSMVLSSPLISAQDWVSDTTIRKKELPEKIQKIIEENETKGRTDSKDYKNAIEEFNRRFLFQLNKKPDIYKKALDNFNLNIYKIMWGPSEFSCTGTLASYERGSDLDKLNVPVLLLCGDRDEVRKETLEKYLKKLPFGSFLYMFRNSTHNTYLESTEIFISQIENFIQRVERKFNEN